MPLKIPPFTPVHLQPEAAEPFSTFVQNTPSALTPLTGTELVPIIQNGASKHVPPNTVGFGPPVRTILTANTNFYVATTGNDSNSGSITSKWATLTHAMQFISANIDFAGFKVTVNIGAGTLQGFGNLGTVGGGILYFKGAGVGSTFIGNGPNDGTINFGECFDQDQATFTQIGFNDITFKPTVNGTFAVWACYIPGQDVFLGDPSFVDPNVLSWDLSATSPTYVFYFSSPSAFLDGQPGTFTVVGGGASISALFTCNNLACFLFGGTWTVTGSLTVTQATIYLQQAMFFWVSGGITGAGVSGPGVLLLDDSSAAGINQGSPNLLGPTFFPGTSFGLVDSSSNYDGVQGPLPGINTQTSSYTLAFTDAGEIVEMNLAGANTLTVPTNASVAFEIGTKIWVTQIGAGATTVAGAGGVTVDNAGVVGGQWKSVKLYKRGTNEWVQTNA